MSDRIKKIVLITCVLFTGIVFYINIAPGLNTRDSGEFLSAAKNLDITHPAGYPLYTITSKLFYVVFDEKGIIFSNIFFSLITLILLSALFKWSVLPTILFTAMFFLKNFYYYSTTAEVYSLNIFLFVLLIFFIKKNNFESAAFTSGFTLLMQPANLLLFFPLYAYVFYKSDNKIKNMTLGFLPLLIYGFLMVRAWNNPPINFGNPVDFVSLIRHIGGFDYAVKSNVLSFSLSTVLSNLWIFLKILILRVEIIFFIPALFFIYKKRQNFSFNLIILITAIINAVFFIVLNLNIQYGFHFLLPAVVCSYILCGEFLEFSNKKIQIVLLFFVIGLTAYFGYYNRPFHTKAAISYAENVLATIKSPAVVFTSIDNRIMYFWYYKYVKNAFDDDIVFINVVNLKDKWYYNHLSKYINVPENPSDNILENIRNLFMFLSSRYNIYFDIEPGYFGLEIPYYRQGLVFQVFRKTYSNDEIFSKLNLSDLPFKRNRMDPELENIGLSFSYMLEDL